jgi:hypothetical protein
MLPSGEWIGLTKTYLSGLDRLGKNPVVLHDEVASGLKRVLKKVRCGKERFPRRLKPHGKQQACGAAEAAPL